MCVIQNCDKNRILFDTSYVKVHQVYTVLMNCVQCTFLYYYFHETLCHKFLIVEGNKSKAVYHKY